MAEAVTTVIDDQSDRGLGCYTIVNADGTELQVDEWCPEINSYWLSAVNANGDIVLIPLYNCPEDHTIYRKLRAAGVDPETV